MYNKCTHIHIHKHMYKYWCTWHIYHCVPMHATDIISKIYIQLWNVQETKYNIITWCNCHATHTYICNIMIALPQNDYHTYMSSAQRHTICIYSPWKYCAVWKEFNNAIEIHNTTNSNNCHHNMKETTMAHLNIWNTTFKNVCDDVPLIGNLGTHDCCCIPINNMTQIHIVHISDTPAKKTIKCIQMTPKTD